MRAVAFLDGQRGAAVLEAAGLATTSDGGRTFVPVDEDGPGEALLVSTVRRAGDGLRAFTTPDGPSAPIDPEQHRLARLSLASPWPAESGLLRWIA